MLPTRWGLNPQPSDHQSDPASNWAIEAGNELKIRQNGPMWNLVKIIQAILDKKTFKDFMILYM